MSLATKPQLPDRMSAPERLTEVAEILAAGLMRLRARQSSRLSGVSENSCVDFTADQSGGAVETLATDNAR
jgi:hypothetical protein